MMEGKEGEEVWFMFIQLKISFAKRVAP